MAIDELVGAANMDSENTFASEVLAKGINLIGDPGKNVKVLRNKPRGFLPDFGVEAVNFVV
jgi:hypothetical protein